MDREQVGHVHDLTKRLLEVAAARAEVEAALDGKLELVSLRVRNSDGSETQIKVPTGAVVEGNSTLSTIYTTLKSVEEALDAEFGQL